MVPTAHRLLLTVYRLGLTSCCLLVFDLSGLQLAKTRLWLRLEVTP